MLRIVWFLFNRFNILMLRERLTYSATSDGYVELVEFGTFDVLAHAECKGRNPQTDVLILIAVSNTSGFKAGMD